MPRHPLAFPARIRSRLLALAALSAFGLSASEAGALRPVQVDPGAVPVEGQPPGSEPPVAKTDPLGDLSEVLKATRAKLEELSEAAANVATSGELRKQAQALKDDNQRLAAELAQATSRQSELENASRLADARIADLSEAVDAGRRGAARLEDALAKLRLLNGQLERSVTGATAARDTAIAKAGKTQSEMTKRLDAASDAAARSNAELEAVRPRLDQAARAAAEAERARQAARSEADALQAEMARTREELAAARTETDRLKTANAELEQQISSLYEESRSATEAARQNLVLMADKIAALNAAVDAVRAPEPAPKGSPEPAADLAGGAAPKAARPTSTTPAPDPRHQADTGPAADSPTQISMVGPATPPAEVDSGLTRFSADIKALNELELSAAGQDVFSGVASVNGREVLVGATAAWNSLPPVGQQSYLDSLLNSWVAVQGGDGPAVVRIVDQNGEVLVEKLMP